MCTFLKEQDKQAQLSLSSLLWLFFIIFLFDDFDDSHITTDVKLEILSGVQKRQHFHAKTTITKLYIYIGLGARKLYFDEAHTETVTASCSCLELSVNLR